MNKDRMKQLADLQEKLSYSFRNPELLSTALTHRSYVNENPRSGGEDNERLEFLGDAVLGLCVSDLLMKNTLISTKAPCQNPLRAGQRKTPGRTGVAAGSGTLSSSGPRRRSFRRPRQGIASGQRAGSGHCRHLSGFKLQQNQNADEAPDGAPDEGRGDRRAGPGL